MYYDEHYSFNYVKRSKAIIISIMKLQQDRGYNIDLPIFKLNLNLRQEKKPEKYLEKYELRALIDQLNTYAKNKRKADMVEFLALTGLRYGELIALREEDLFEGYIKVTGTIDFRQGVYGDNIRTTPKTNAAFRSVSLSDRAIEILFKILQENELYKLSKGYKNDGYIFTNHKGNPIDYRTFEPTIKRAGIKAKIDKPVTSHVLRHTHISFLAEFGLPIKAIMERVGHKDSSTTLQIYTHVTSKMKNQLVDILNTLDY